MSITPYLGDFNASPETKRVLGVALEMTRVSLGLADDFADGIITKRIVERAKAGERNPDLLCQGALEELRGHFVRRLTSKNDWIGLAIECKHGRTALLYTPQTVE